MAKKPEKPEFEGSKLDKVKQGTQFNKEKHAANVNNPQQRNRHDKVAVNIGKTEPPERESILSRQDGHDVEAGMALMRGGEIPPGRMPGLIPFTTVPFVESLADRLYDEAIIHGWMSCIDKATKRRRERWCALHENYMYEFAERYNQFVLADKISLEGCVCFRPKDSPDTFVVRTGGLFSITSTRVLVNEIVYTADLPETVEDWVKAIALSSVIQVMRERKVVPQPIKEKLDGRAGKKPEEPGLSADFVRPRVQEPIPMRFVSRREVEETTKLEKFMPDHEGADGRGAHVEEEGGERQGGDGSGPSEEAQPSLEGRVSEKVEDKSKRRRDGQRRSKRAEPEHKPTVRDIARMGSRAAAKSHGRERLAH
uniref:PH domain-containing protein n=1 Tax=Guillardia theta TaxID=55529 RepID=A0A7S4KF71_GUITH